MLISLLLIIFSFVLIWLSSRLIIKNICNLSHLLILSPFAISFFILGLGTSMPEFFISVSAALDKHPEIFAGTLMGASIVVFLFVIPVLSILGNGIISGHFLKQKTLVYALFVVILPFLAALDGQLNRKEGLIMILSYFVLFYLIEKRQGFFQKVEQGFMTKRRAELSDFGKILLGALVLFFAAQILVANTVVIAGYLHISAFIISILLLSIGTDLPETSVAIYSALKNTKSVAMGDYIGSAAANTLILGALTLIYGNFRFADQGFMFTTLIFFLGLILFFFFSRSKSNLSRIEGIGLFLIYALFIAMKILA